MNGKLGRFVYALLAGVFMVTALFLLKAREAEPANAVPFALPKDAAKTYQERIRETERLLKDVRVGRGA